MRNALCALRQHGIHAVDGLEVGAASIYGKHRINRFHSYGVKVIDMCLNGRAVASSGCHFFVVYYGFVGSVALGTVRATVNITSRKPHDSHRVVFAPRYRNRKHRFYIFRAVLYFW